MVAACDVWRANADARRVLADFASYADGAPLQRCPALHALFGNPNSAPRFVAGIVRAFSAALLCEPFGQPPLRHGHDRGCSTLLLARSGRAQLVLHAREPGRHRFAAVCYSDGERREAMLAGRARGRIVRRQRPFGMFAMQPLTLQPGVRLALDLRGEALQVLAITRRLVSLRLHRSAPRPVPSREYDLASGTLLRQAAGDMCTSRQEAMLALLGRMGRTGAAPVMAEIAREPGDASLRWQALRECLALDTAAGLAVLGELACAAGDPLAIHAGALRTQLLDAHPALAGVPCLA